MPWGYQHSPPGNNQYEVVGHFLAEVATFKNTEIARVKNKKGDLPELIRPQDAETDYNQFFSACECC